MRPEKKRSPWIPPPDFRNTERGKRWLKVMIEASEGKRSTEDLLDEMQTPVPSRRQREPGDDDEEL